MYAAVCMCTTFWEFLCRLPMSPLTFGLCRPCIVGAVHVLRPASSPSTCKLADHASGQRMRELSGAFLCSATVKLPSQPLSSGIPAKVPEMPDPPGLFARSNQRGIFVEAAALKHATPRLSQHWNLENMPPVQPSPGREGHPAREKCSQPADRT